MVRIPNTNMTCLEDDSEVLDFIETLPHKGKYLLKVLDIEGDMAHIFPTGYNVGTPLTLSLLVKFSKEGDAGLMCFQCPWDYMKELQTLVTTFSKTPNTIFYDNPKIYKHVFNQIESLIKSEKFLTNASTEEVNKYMADIKLALQDPETSQKLVDFVNGKFVIARVDDL